MIYGHYLPVIGLIGLEHGVEAWHENTYAQGVNARQVSDVFASQTALTTGEVDILFSGGE